jgi:hypothetical protein
LERVRERKKEGERKAVRGESERVTKRLTSGRGRS